MPTTTLLKTGLSTAVITSIVFFASLYREPLFEKSLTVIPELQEGASDFKQSAWNIYSNWGLALIIILPIALTYLFLEQRSRCFYYVFMGMGMEAFSNLLKLYDHQARPYWVGANVQAFDCSNQYGNPSGHSCSSMAIALAVWLDFNSWAITNTESKSLLRSLKCRVALFVLVLTFSFSIAYSRLFLGVHSLNQVFYGLQCGVWFALTAHFIIREPLMQLVQDLIDVKEKRLCSMAMSSTAILVFCLLLQIFNNENVRDFVNPSSWSSMMVEKCGKESLEGAYQAFSLISFCHIMQIFGAFYGILAMQKVYPGIISSLHVDLAGDSWLKRVTRLMIAFILVKICMFFNHAISKSTNDLEDYFKMFIAINFNLLIGMSVFMFADLLNRQLGLLSLKPINAAKASYKEELSQCGDDTEQLLTVSGCQDEEEKENLLADDKNATTASSYQYQYSKSEENLP